MADTHLYRASRTDAEAKGSMGFIAFMLTGLVAVKLVAAQVEQQPPQTKVLPTVNAPPPDTRFSATRG